MAIVRLGAVHGRFQPFHLGHLEYVMAALRKCDLLYVGLTSYDRASSQEELTAPHRHLASSNPFTFFERLEMVRLALLEARVEERCFRIVPFPIQDCHRVTEFVPREACHFVTVYDAWGDAKCRRLEAAGLQVDVLWRRTHRLTSGTELRQKLMLGAPVTGLVPPAVEQFLSRSLVGARACE